MTFTNKPRPVPSAPGLQMRTHLSSHGKFAIASIPRRGWPAAQVWPDTGVLLAVGRKPAVLREFAAHYNGRITVVLAVRDEIRRKAAIPPALRRHDDVHACDAAGKVMSHALDPGLLPVAATRPALTKEQI